MLAACSVDSTARQDGPTAWRNLLATPGIAWIWDVRASTVCEDHSMADVDLEAEEPGWPTASQMRALVDRVLQDAEATIAAIRTSAGPSGR